MIRPRFISPVMQYIYIYISAASERVANRIVQMLQQQFVGLCEARNTKMVPVCEIIFCKWIITVNDEKSIPK